jgi:hypothetical protein
MPMSKRTILLETKVMIYGCYIDPVLNENEWGGGGIRFVGLDRSRSECLRRETDRPTEPPSGDSGRVEKERVHRERRNTLSGI